ncbi:CocE/NonD family hydrolase [Thalassotalea crassostreae]|uniref:CocE/NonD family hydrolase n=1 Tax=Thalassotalea crassostreae TaxID=1763536 RepID=UPI0008384B3B|nr:CocE/NonD family hydrolase [Thalassotalea crassostreae]
MSEHFNLKKCQFWVLLVSTFLSFYTYSKTQNFDGWERKSVYIEARDGVKLAVDYYRPTLNGKLHKKPLPVAWRFTPYGRFKLDNNGKLNTNILPNHGGDINGPQAVERLLKQGYIVAIADIRGFGASHGYASTWLGMKQAEDSFDITNWLVEQPFTTEEVAMFGKSYLGSVQYIAAIKPSPYLKAIFPAMAQFDQYETAYLNGIYRQDLGWLWQNYIRSKLDFPTKIPSPNSVAPVDLDLDRSLLAQASFGHQWNRNFSDEMRAAKYRDSVDAITGKRIHIENSPLFNLDAINKSGVAIYHWTGWFDAYGKGQTQMYANLDLPQKLHIGPYFHGEHFGIDMIGEMIKWFDYHVKGINNGVMNEDPIRYFIIGDSIDDGWKTTKNWPLSNESRIKYYFSEGKSGTVKSINDSKLSTSNANKYSRDNYQVDYSISLGGYVERNNGSHRDCSGKQVVEDFCYKHSGYADLSERYDSKALTYTSNQIEQDMLIIGYPVVDFWLSVSTDDGDLYVTLEHVESDGTSRFISDNALKISHRALSRAPFDNFGLPWLGNYEKDISKVKGNPVRIQLDLKPIAIRLKEGSRIRVTIAGADSKSGTAPWDRIEKTLTIHKGGKFRSFIELPVIK